MHDVLSRAAQRRAAGGAPAAIRISTTARLVPLIFSQQHRYEFADKCRRQFPH